MRDNGSFVRWQANTQNQLGYAIGLILSLSTASLGFAVIRLEGLLDSKHCAALFFLALSIIALVASEAAAIACTINRLLDFRKTARIARDREDWVRENLPATEISERLKERRAGTKKLGETTWNLFWWQIGTFAVGIAALLIGIAFEFAPQICQSSGG
jgi:hypothetical protein